MSQATAFTLADGQATPVNITFSPERVTPELSTFVDRSSGIAARFRRLSARFNPATNGRKSNKAQLNISIPVVGVMASGQTGVIYTLRSTISYELPDGCTDAERKDLHALTVNALGQALLRGVMRDLDPLY